MYEGTVYMESSDFDKLEAQRIICLFLAQDEDPEKPHKQLGFETAQSAFKEIGELFGRKKNTIKNERDAFDYYTDSSRVGWKANLKPSLDLIWKKYGDISREKLLQMSLNFIETLKDNKGMSQLNIFNEVANLDVKTEFKPPDAFNIIEFAPPVGPNILIEPVEALAPPTVILSPNCGELDVPKPILVLAPAAVVAPVPPKLTGTVPAVIS